MAEAAAAVAPANAAPPRVDNERFTQQLGRSDTDDLFHSPVGRLPQGDHLLRIEWWWNAQRVTVGIGFPSDVDSAIGDRLGRVDLRGPVVETEVEVEAIRALLRCIHPHEPGGGSYSLFRRV